MQVEDVAVCSGCSLCSQICPKGAIKMVQDQYGFMRPKVDMNLCIDCGICVKNCNVIAENVEFSPKYYAAKNIDLSVRMNSSSGGVFFELARYFISNKHGVVYGAAYDIRNEMRVTTIRVDKIEDVNKLMGSKYVQSDMDVAYLAVKKDLQNNICVCFSGTPCQVNALLSYLKQNKVSTDMLFTCDFVCHGVPSPRVWREYVQTCESLYNDKMIDYRFRYKDNDCNWGTINVCAQFNSNKLINTDFLKSYINLYFANLMTRPDCQKCQFAKLERVSDLTLADCWGIERAKPNFYDRNGVSMIIVSSQKSLEVLNTISASFELSEVDINLLDQPHLSSPCILSDKSETFWHLFEQKGYLACAKKYTEYGFLFKKYKAIRGFLGRQKNRILGHRRSNES